MSQSNSPLSHGVRQGLVLLAVIVTIVFNSLSQTIPIGGRTSAEVSNQYPTFFTPANYAFAIWGVIYLLLVVYGIYQVLPAQRHNAHIRQIDWLFIVSCILNCTWIVLFQYNLIAISVLVIIAFLITLIFIYLRLDIGHAEVSSAERLFVHLPFSVYLGWLSVATIANIAVFGVSQNWGDLLGIPAPTWAAIMLVVATLVGLILAVTQRDIGYVLVFVWAFTAIINKQAGYPVVTTTALVMVIVLLVVLVGSVLVNYRRAGRLL